MKEGVGFLEWLKRAFRGVFGFLKKKEREEAEVVSETPGEEAEGTVAAPPEKEQGKFSLKERSIKVRGINKKVTFRTLAGVGLVFIVAFYFAFSGGDAPAKKSPNDGMAQQEINDKNSPAGGALNSGLPSNYGSLAAFNDKKQQQMAKNAAGQPGGQVNGDVNGQVNVVPNQSVNQANGSVYSNGNGTQVRQQQSTYQPSPQQQQQQVPVVAQQQGVATVPQQQQPQKVAETFSAPIRFSLEGLASLASSTVSASNSSSAGSVGGYVRNVPNTLQPGTIIPATLMSGINSDMPGQVVAQVRQNVYDSVTGSVLLVPQGSRLIGKYGGTVGSGQERISVNWQTLILPNGDNVNLSGMVAVDSQGYAGLRDQVDDHTGSIFGITALTSVLSAVGTVAGGGVSSDEQSVSQLAASGATTNLVNVVSKLLDKKMDVSPTITVRPGFNFEVFVGQALVLNPY